MSAIDKDLGMATAYAYAVSKGYTGTEEEFAQYIANVGQNAQAAAESAESAARSATTAGQSAESAAQSALEVSGAVTDAEAAATAAGESEAAAVESAADAETEALKSEGHAVGKQDGVDVDAQSEYYQNNSKYYSDRAKDIYDDAVEVRDSIPADYSQLSQDVTDLKADLNESEKGNAIIEVTWESGSIMDGTNVDSNTNIRTVDYIDLSTDTVKRIITTATTVVMWWWYDENKNYISNSYGSNTINGTYNIGLNSYASYVRFAAVTHDKSQVKIAKDTQAVIAKTQNERTAEAHNQLANGLCEFVCSLQRGILNTSTGEEDVNNSFVRTDYINIADYKITGYYAPISASLNVIEYASDKTFVKRTLYNNTGVVNISFNNATAYVRFTWLQNKTVKILQSAPFMVSSEKQQIIDGLKLGIANIKNLSEKCIHHDNFSRTESDYDIGKNSEGTLTDNSYDTVTGVSADDGVRVDNGLTISADNTRPFNFTVRKISSAHTSNFMVEFNAPASNQSVYIIYKLTDANNFTAINIAYNGTYYSCIQRTIANGSFNAIIDNINIYNSTGYVIRLYFLSGVIAVFIDDKYCYSFYADKIDDYLYIGSYRGVTAHFDFINIFDLITPLIWNTEYLTDSGVQSLPNSSLSANENRYALDDSVTRFSNKSEHFMLYSTDEKINNGKRTERSLVALIPKNLRTMRYEFDVLFPASVSPDTASSSYGDIFFQLHDRQSGVSRGHVPFDLSLVGNEIHFSQYYASAQASETLIAVVSGVNLGTVTYDKWMHFDIFIKERYDERQHPFIEIKINNETVYQSRKPNCANDVKGTSAQYGEYKNNFDLITYSERYIDNFKVTY
jgi:hypothetical protein